MTVRAGSRRQVLNPNKVEGRLMLITRYGKDKVETMLPPHIKAVQEAGVPVVWQCDGVHGNTVTAAIPEKLKTRKCAAALLPPSCRPPVHPAAAPLPPLCRPSAAPLPTLLPPSCRPPAALLSLVARGR